MSIIGPVLVVLQIACLLTGCVQGWRYRNSVDCAAKAIPWLIPAMLAYPIFRVLQWVAGA